MKLFYKYSLSAMAALSSLVGCADKPQPPEPTPTPTVVKTNVSGISGMDVILRCAPPTPRRAYRMNIP